MAASSEMKVLTPCSPAWLLLVTSEKYRRGDCVTIARSLILLSVFVLQGAGDSLTQAFVDAAGAVGQHSLPSHGMFLAARLSGEIQQGRFF